MIAYHEISSEAKNSVLKNGIKRESRGDKGDDPAITETDHFLDTYCPERLKRLGLSRNNNVYAYVNHGDEIIDITDGKGVKVDDFVKKSKQTVLELAVDPKRCYVSDLDVYDRVKKTADKSQAKALLYWQALIPLHKYKSGTIKRPEIMITYDIPVSKIRVAV